MSTASLAAQYRPQTFAEVVGQETVKAILSRAAAEDRVAPAYLLSGTRGVGKTTIARIFAKALNCERAPTDEPCNQCDACRRITQGSFVDVVEIDGASNRGIDDVRRIRDAIGYSTLEGRYKVIIIDEAHMLTEAAFNALLKTLEEPPARVAFILATTEQHKFPATIISRCQHFVFRQIPEARLEEHVISVLKRENRPFEPDAARLIARRAAGSVRDSMSLLSQTLALAPNPDQPLTAADARQVLGLAGQEVMDRLLTALAAQNGAAVSSLVAELLDQGVDTGFFLRELATLWRNLFILRQTSGQAVPDLPPAELERLRAFAENFKLSYIHAAWQMTLDSQRKILTSLEPAAALELLLLNLAVLPRLLPLDELQPKHVAPEACVDASRPNQPDPPSSPPGPTLKSTPGENDSPAAEESRSAKNPADLEAIKNPLPQGEEPEGLEAVLPPEISPELTWESFLAYCEANGQIPLPVLKQFTGRVEDSELIIQAQAHTLFNEIQKPKMSKNIAQLARGWAGRKLTVSFLPPVHDIQLESDLIKKMEAHPTVQSIINNYNASLLGCFKIPGSG